MTLAKEALKETIRRVAEREKDRINPPEQHDYVLRMFDENKINRFTEILTELEADDDLLHFWNELVYEFEVAENYIAFLEWNIMELQRRLK